MRSIDLFVSQIVRRHCEGHGPDSLDRTKFSFGYDMSPQRKRPIRIRPQAVMSGIVSININIEIFIPFAYQFKDNSCIVLFISIFTDDVVIYSWFGTSAIYRHVNYHFISYLAFFLELYSKTSQSCSVFTFLELILYRQSRMSQLLIVIRVSRVNSDIVTFDLIVSRVLLTDFIEELLNLISVLHLLIQRLYNIRCIEKPLDSVLINKNVFRTSTFIMKCK